MGPFQDRIRQIPQTEETVVDMNKGRRTKHMPGFCLPNSILSAAMTIILTIQAAACEMRGHSGA
jgi:hypothetical protein